MTRWRDLSDAQRHVLDAAVADNTILFELALPVTFVGPRETRHEDPLPWTDLADAAGRLLDDGLIVIARRVSPDHYETLDATAAHAVLASPTYWDPDGRKDVVLYATAAGQRVADGG